MTLRVIKFVGLATGFLFCLSCASMTVVQMQGNAMLPTYRNGDRLAIRKDVSQIDRLDVIIFLYPQDTSKTYIKRVIGLPGETVSIAKGKVTIDGKDLAEPYVDQTLNTATDVERSWKIPADDYFVLGDDRDNSSDSRYWGMVRKELIIGKCFLSY